MNEAINTFELILNASLPVLLVMVLLTLVSIVSWVLIAQRWMVLTAARAGILNFEERFWSGIDLSELYHEGTATLEEDIELVGMEHIFRAGFNEFMKLRQQGAVGRDAVIEGAQRAMRVAYSREEHKLERHLPFLATVASVSPYVGLFGTVIGIMNAFIGLANQAQATLQVVAPSIAEALLATGLGLFAAIPALVAFNRFSAAIESVTGSYITFSDEFSTILHRQIHSGGANRGY